MLTKNVTVMLLIVLAEAALGSGADPGFKVRGAHLKKLRRAEGGSKIVGVFRPCG